VSTPRTFRLPLELPAEFTVGEWARAVRRAADRVPRQLLDSRGHWHYNPDRAAAEREVSDALVTVAAHLGIPVSEVGPCATCRAYHHRYGDGGGPLCPTCLAVVVARRRRVVPAVPAVPEPVREVA
jgi:hypothetical protein